MRHTILIVALSCLTLATVRAQDVQVALDETGDVMVVDRTMDGFEEIFPEFRGFQEARLFRIAEDRYVLEVLYRPDEDVLRERRELTAEEVQALRARVSAAMPSEGPTPARVDQTGRPRLLRQVAVTSLLLYGPALPVALDVQDERAASALYLATASAGFFVPYFLTQNAPVSQGAATLSRFGAGHGAVHGFSLALLVGGEDVSGRALFGVTALGSAVEAALGYRFATSRGMNRGTAATIGAGAALGTVAGLSLGGILSVPPDDDDQNDPDINDPDEDFYEDEDYFDANLRIFGGSMLVGSLAGGYAGYALAQREPHTRGDARVLTTAGLLGTNLGGLAIDVTNTDHTRAAFGMLAAGTVGGMVAGRLLTTGRDFTAAQGAYIGLGALAGALAGQSVAAAVDAGVTPSYVLGTAGATGVFALMYAAFADDAREAASGRTMGALDFEVNPMGLLGAIRGQAPVGTGLFRLSARW